MTLQQRINQLRERGKNIPNILDRAQRAATARAIEVATELTPPNKDTGPRGAGTITGAAKAGWSEGSEINPTIKGNTRVTILGNPQEYISYVNDGHPMSKHFVPGLVINPSSGLLEKVDPSQGGIVVGTQTQYVEGLYMKEQAIDAYEQIIHEIILEETEKLFDE